MIKREDLVAAAAVGLLQYREIDPLLVFLLQRDVLARREALLAPARGRRGQRGQRGVNQWLSYLLGALVVVTVALFAVLFASHAVQSSGMGTLFFFAALYGLSAFSLASWIKRRGFCRSLRLLAAVVIASVPLAVFALQQVAR